MSKGERPDWADEIITLSLETKADARRVVRLCEAGSFYQPWKPSAAGPIHYVTAEGRIRQTDYLRAIAIAPEPIRKKERHNWEFINILIDEVAAEKDVHIKWTERINRTKLRRRVAELYRERMGLMISADSGPFKKRVRDRLRETGLD